MPIQCLGPADGTIRKAYYFIMLRSKAVASCGRVPDGPRPRYESFGRGRGEGASFLKKGSPLPPQASFPFFPRACSRKQRINIFFTDGYPCFFGLCYSLWLFHVHSTLKIQPFSPVFLLAGTTDKAFCLDPPSRFAPGGAGATDKAFCRVSLWSKEKSINHFL